MPYDNNTYISDKGRALTRSLFHNLFKNDGDKMDVSSASTIVDHFRGSDGSRFHQSLSIVKQFISGYQHSGYIRSWDTGIMICPYCQRRDFMPFWEFVDFGFRNDNDEWTSTVKPLITSKKVGYDRTAAGTEVFSRVRCNDATTCNDCHTTVTGHYSRCRNTSCNSSNVSQVGCGREFAHQACVRSFSVAEWHNINRRNSDPGKRVFEKRGGNVVPAYGVRPFFYRMVYAGPYPEGQVLTEPSTSFEYIPQLEIGYESIMSGVRRPYGYKCPDENCEFERYAPLNGESYDIPTGQISEYNKTKKTCPATTRDGQPLSTGPYATFNQDGSEANGGLVNNMGNCPYHPELVLVPRISIKRKLSSNCFDSKGSPKNARKTARATGYSYGSWSRDTGKGLSYEDQKAIGEVMEYTNEQLARNLNAEPTRFPLSPLLRMFTEKPKEVCDHCVTNGWDENDNFFYSPSEGHTLACQNCGKWEPEYRRPHSEGINDVPILYQISNEQPLMRPSGQIGPQYTDTIWPIRLDCPQIPEEALKQECLQLWAGIPYPGGPQGAPPTGNGIRVCPNDEKYESATSEQVRAEKLAEEASKITPTETDENLIETVLTDLDGESPEPGVSMRDYFNQQKSAQEVPDLIRINSRIQYDPDSISGDFVTITSPHLLKYRPIDIPTELPGRRWSLTVRTDNILLAQSEDSLLGETAPGYTYVVTEGRSRECFQHSNRPRWLDASPEVSTYHNRDNPESALGSPRQYPRWTQTPDWDIRPPRPGEGFNGNFVMADGDYFWNSENHMAQDRYRINAYLSVFMPSSANPTPMLASKYHDFYECADPMISVETGNITIIYECRTCKTIWDIGNEMQGSGTYEPGAATTQYYQSRGLIDSEGNTTDPSYFPQEVFESALEREGDQISNLGVEDSTLQAMGRGGGNTAKHMLDNPKLVVKTDE
jgi:hypothetical protein